MDRNPAVWDAPAGKFHRGGAVIPARRSLSIWTISGGSVASGLAVVVLAGASAVISLVLMYLDAVYLDSVAMLGLTVTALGISTSLFYLRLGQQMLGRDHEAYFLPSLLLAMVFPSGLVLSNARATYEAFAGTPMDFTRTPKSGAVIVGGWRGSPELVAGISLPVFALTEQAWSLPFFIIAAAGLLLIGGMGWQGTARLPTRDAGPGE